LRSFSTFPALLFESIDVPNTLEGFSSFAKEKLASETQTSSDSSLLNPFVMMMMLLMQLTK